MERAESDPISKLVSQRNQRENLSYSMVDQVKKIVLEHCQMSDPTSIIEHEIETKKRLEQYDFINNLAKVEPRDSIVSLSILWSIPGIASLVHWDHVNGLYENIRRETDRFIEAYRQASHEESIMMASCFSDLLAHAHGAVHMGPLLEITLACQAFSDKPVLAQKILEHGNDAARVTSWAGSDTGRYSQAQLWRLYDAPDAKNEGIQQIAKDGLALTDANTVIIDIATLSNSPQQPTRKQLEQNPKSTDLRFLLEYYSADQKTRSEYDPEDVYDVYELGVEPYLSDEDRRRFLRYRQNVESYPLLTQLIERLIQQANYTRVHFQPLFNSPTISSFEDLRDRTTFSQVHRVPVRMSVEEDLGTVFTDLRLREQRSLLVYISHCLRPEYEKTCSVIKRFGINAARTFLALETDAAHGERILAFANTADPAVAKQVFEAFARIADTIDLSAQELAKQLYKDDGQTVDAERVRNELIKRGSRILLDAETALAEDPSGVGIFEQLQRYEADTVLFTSLFSSAFKGKEAPFETLRDLETQTCELTDLSPEDRSRMKQLLDQEWSKKPLEFLFPETGTFRFFILRRRGRIEGFMRFEDQSNTSRHANFLCVDHSLRGSGVGENVLREAIARAGRNVTLHAEFDAAIPAGSMYIERFGFVGTGIEAEDRDGTLVEWVRIERSDTLLKQLSSRTASHEQLRHWARTEAPSPLILTTLEGPANTMELGMLAAVKQAKTLNQKYVLSRYLLEPLTNGQERRILVFDLPTPAASPSATKTQTSGGAKKRSTRPGSPVPHRDHYAE